MLIRKLLCAPVFPSTFPLHHTLWHLIEKKNKKCLLQPFKSSLISSIEFLVAENLEVYQEYAQRGCNYYTDEMSDFQKMTNIYLSV